MNCPTCATPLGPGVLVCPNCGASTSRSSGPVQVGQPMSSTSGGVYPGSAPMATYGARQTSSLAVASLCFGIGSWILLPLIGAVAAVILGHMARKEIAQNPGRLEGDGLAIAGLITGYLNLAMSCIAGGILLLAFGGMFAAAAAGAQ